MRSLSIRRKSDDKRKFEVVIATENPVKRYSYRDGQLINEVLIVGGVEFRTDRKQVPISDTHNTGTVRSVLGSVRNIRVEGDELVGDAHFADDPVSMETYAKVRDGHITDFSINATPNEIVRVEAGSSYTTPNGAVIPGPAEIITRWQPVEASAVTIGADERSTVRDAVRRSYDISSNPQGDNTVDELRKILIAAGMPESVERSLKAMTEWALAHGVNVERQVEAAKAEIPAPPVVEQVDRTEEVKRAIADERKRVSVLRSIGEQAAIEAATVNEWIDNGLTPEVARERALEVLSSRTPASGSNVTVVNVTGEGRERLQKAISGALVKRAIATSGIKRDAYSGGQEPEGSDDFARHSMLRMCERLLTADGVSIERMSNREIALVAMGHEPTIQRLNVKRAAYHTTGSFSNVLLDASNKSLLAGYDEAPYTWSLWARQAASVSDFKNINRMRFSEAPDLQVVPENTEYKEGAMSDSKETYSVEKFGRMFSVSWETVVNDDLDAIGRVPAMQGNAARRTQNRKVYEVLTANAVMGDNVALFHANHSNLSGASADPSVTTLNAVFLAMMTQTGLNSSVTINVQPRYIIVPAALGGTLLQLLNSIADPAAGGSAAGNSNTANIYARGNARGNLVPVIEPELDATSATVWYAAADPGQVDTVELSFLEGEESPVLESEWNFKTDGWSYKVRQTFGVKAIDWRGLYKYST